MRFHSIELPYRSDAAHGSLLIHQDARVFAARLDGAEKLDHPLAAGLKAYLRVARGSLQANGYALAEAGVDVCG